MAIEIIQMDQGTIDLAREVIEIFNHLLIDVEGLNANLQKFCKTKGLKLQFQVQFMYYS